jgi:hypothetical protein
MPSTELRNKRVVNPFGAPGDVVPVDTPAEIDGTYDLDPADIRQRPFPAAGQDSFPDDPSSLGFDG